MFTRSDPTPYHEGNPPCHWSPDSSSYAPADLIWRYLDEGWVLYSLATVKSFWHHGVRRTDVYYFTLFRDDEQIEIPVLVNPAVMKLVEEHHLTVVETGEDWAE